MMSVHYHRHAFKESAKIHAHMNNVASKHFAQSVCTEQGANVHQDTKVVPMLNASPMSVSLTQNAQQLLPVAMRNV